MNHQPLPEIIGGESWNIQQNKLQTYIPEN